MSLNTYLIKQVRSDAEDGVNTVVRVDFDRKIIYVRNQEDEFSCREMVVNRNIYVRLPDSIYEDIKNQLCYANVFGAYALKDNVDTIDYIAYGSHNFPYTRLTRDYEAVYHIAQFQGKEQLPPTETCDIVDRQLQNRLAFTIGIEYETSMGFLPFEKCVKMGLIPLRDGSISGCEYSTIVMGKDHLPLIRQQLENLKEYTFFDKECALHMHFGGFPVDPMALFMLSYIEANLEQQMFDNTIPKFSFQTGMYKANGKDYCRRLLVGTSFKQMYEYYVGQRYFGSLTQSHPNDPDRSRKWEVGGRYFGMNLINMLCYESPKTIEFRFLRPTYNYRKIRYWIAVFNAILLWAMKGLASLGDHPTEGDVVDWVGNNLITLEVILTDIYKKDGELLSELLHVRDALKIVVKNQSQVSDNWGGNTDLEDKILSRL